MTFVYPTGLFGLLSIPVILTIHLLRERRRRYLVSSLRPWSFLEAEVRGALPSHLPLSWLLLFDILVATSLSLAWAQPRLPFSLPERGARQLIVLLDTSTSIRAHDVPPSRFDEARQEALFQLGSLSSRDVGTVIAFDRVARWVGDTRQISLDDLIQRVEALKPVGSGSEVVDALASAQAAVDAELPVEIHVLSDNAYTQPLQTLNDYPVQWHIFGASDDNQAVLDLSAIQVNAARLQVFARVDNFSSQPARRVVTLQVDRNVVDSSTLDMNAGSSTSLVWDLNTNARFVSVALAGGDELLEDDQAVYTLPKTGQINVGLVAENPDPIDRALSAVPGVNLRRLTQQEYTPGTDFDLTVFRGALPNTWPMGNVLVIDPPPDSPLLAIEGKTPIENMPVGVQDPLLNGVDFTGVRWGNAWSLTEIPDFLLPVVRAGKLPLLLEGNTGASHIILLLADLSSGNLLHHPSFPILIANIVQTASQTNWPPSIQVGQSLNLHPATRYGKLRIIPPDGSLVEWIDEYPIQWQDALQPGLYRIEETDQDGRRRSDVAGSECWRPN